MHKLRSLVVALAHDATLYNEHNFVPRCEALDKLEVHVVARLAGLRAHILSSAPQRFGRARRPAARRKARMQPASCLLAALCALRRAAARVVRRLEAVDERLFQRLRAEIRRGSHRGAAFTNLIERYLGHATDDGWARDHGGYDAHDLFLNRLLFSQPLPTPTQTLVAEMVPCQPTPARIIFTFVVQAQLKPEDLFYDVGAGLGRVAIIVHLLTGAHTIGIEYEPAFCAYARNCVHELGLTQVEFAAVDARDVSYVEGSTFFLYTPCKGDMLQAVLERLRAAARTRTIKLFSYGPCTVAVARQPWLAPLEPHSGRSDRLAGFSST